MKQKHIIISGRVQGVGFRFFAKKSAELLNIKGWVMNNFNEQVEILAQGSDDDLKEFIIRLRQGPGRSVVSDVKVIDEIIKDKFNSFSVKF